MYVMSDDCCDVVSNVSLSHFQAPPPFEGDGFELKDISSGNS
jgi:hypothetical protein